MEVSMPLMDEDDYFVQEETLTLNGVVVTLKVSVKQFDPYSAQF